MVDLPNSIFSAISTSSRSLDWRQDACIKSVNVFLAGFICGLVSWKHEFAGDCNRFNLGVGTVVDGDVCLAAMGFIASAPEFVVACNGNMGCRERTQPMAVFSTDASQQALGGEGSFPAGSNRLSGGKLVRSGSEVAADTA